VDLARANWLTFHPLTVSAALLLAGLAAWAERRLDHAVEFPVGLLIGETAVLFTILLNGLVLLGVGTHDWTGIVLLTFVIHLPLAVVEGIILGFTVGFLARVKPQLLYGYRPPERGAAPCAAFSSAPVGKIVALLLAPLLLLACAKPAFAHRLEAEYRVLPDKRIEIESWFDLTGDSPRGAKVRVTRPDGSVLVEGELDAKGMFVFPFDKAETLKVFVDAGMGHARELQIPEGELAKAGAAKSDLEPPTSALSPGPFADRSSKLQFRDILIALAFIFGLAAFVLSLRHSYALRDLKRQQENRAPAAEAPLPNGSNSANHHIRPPHA
jgi:hypothetical protein